MSQLTTKPYNRKDSILHTAIKLFNQNMATNVSTVQIADALNISTGNLYYYFKNKEHIIREIYQNRIVSEMDEAAYDKSLRLSESGIIEYFSRIGKCMYRYRFFFSELYSLLVNDPELKAMYRERAKRIGEVFQEIPNTWIAVGIMKPTPQETISFLSDIAWRITQMWIPMQNIFYDNLTSKEIALDCFKNVLALFHPYFTETAIQRMEALLQLIACDE